MTAKDMPYITMTKPFGCTAIGADNRPNYAIYFEGEELLLDSEQFNHLCEVIDKIKNEFQMLKGGSNDA